MKAAMSRGTGLDIDSIREEVRVALVDPDPQKWKDLQKKYPYVGEKDTKKAAEGGIIRLGYQEGGEVDAPWWKFWGGAADPEQTTEEVEALVQGTQAGGSTLSTIQQRALDTARAAQAAGIPLTPDQEQLIIDAEALGLAYGGRARYYAGGQSTPSEYTIEDAVMATTQDKLGGITDVMKQSDLFRQGSVGQMYAANGGRMGYDAGGSASDRYEKKIAEFVAKGLSRELAEALVISELSPDAYTIIPEDKAQGGRIGAEEGGLMNLGGMEKDYRNDGGFVPIGGEEKADDVPARLSKNEFVFTADAVRGAGGGDIDKGAEIMENIMKNLEQGGQISEETQGLSGAQEMFDVSERLSEVV
jgi:hypothetical protein